jgi:hypothetical protein
MWCCVGLFERVPSLSSSPYIFRIGHVHQISAGPELCEAESRVAWLHGCFGLASFLSEKGKADEMSSLRTSTHGPC